MNKEQPELTALQLAYNQGIEDALCAIRAESQGGGYWAATYINAIARRCSPFWHVAAKFTAPTYDQAVQAITDIRGARESHVQWAAHLRDTKREDCKGCDDHAAHIGDAAYHDEWIAKYDNVIYVLAHAPFTDAAATTSPETPKSDDAWREWFDRIGDKASAEVVNATADLVTNERLAALVQAGVVPSPETPVGGEARICLTCGHEERFSDNEGGTCEKIVDEESNFCGCVCRFAAPVHAAGDTKCIHCDPSFVPTGPDDWCNCKCHNTGEF